MSIWKKLISGVSLSKSKNSPLGVTPTGAWSALQNVFLNSNEQQQQEIMRWVESGGDVNWSCAAGMTLLHYAAMQGNEPMVQFLLDHGANVDDRAKTGRTPLLLACANIKTAVIPMLLEHGADVNAEDGEGSTPLELISKSGSDEARQIAELLVAYGGQHIIGKTCICDECGAPDKICMQQRGVQASTNAVYVEFACRRCFKRQQIALHSIDKANGLKITCQSCRAIMFIPPMVWCRTCGIGLSTGWQKHVTRI